MKTRCILMVLGVAGFALITASPAHAVILPTRTWVSGFGSDGNTGTRTSPYATFATAVTNTAAGGTVSVADPGDFGPVTISQAITIDGGGVEGAITFTGSIGISINAGATDTVVLRHLSIDGAGLGVDAIFLSSAASLIIEDCSLRGFTDIGIGIGSGAAQNVSIKNTTITGGTLGVRVFQGPGPVATTLRNMTITGATSAGIFIRSGVLDVSNSTISQNAIALQNDTSSTITAEGNMISQNGTAAIVFSTSKIRLSNNDMVDNTTGISLAGGILMSAGNNRRGGNVTPGAPNGTMNSF